jgi:hypothetical protein
MGRLETLEKNHPEEIYDNGVEALVPSRGRWSSETMDASTEAVV